MPVAALARFSRLIFERGSLSACRRGIVDHAGGGPQLLQVVQIQAAEVVAELGEAAPPPTDSTSPELAE
jgi:hypothetical protein